ncbi:hypothetical protein ABH940_006814 [Streptacidiphilus sp. BW17]
MVPVAGEFLGCDGTSALHCGGEPGLERVGVVAERVGEGLVAAVGEDLLAQQERVRELGCAGIRGVDLGDLVAEPGQQIGCGLQCLADRRLWVGHAEGRVDGDPQPAKGGRQAAAVFDGMLAGLAGDPHPSDHAPDPDEDGRP